MSIWPDVAARSGNEDRVWTLGPATGTSLVTLARAVLEGQGLELGGGGMDKS